MFAPLGDLRRILYCCLQYGQLGQRFEQVFADREHAFNPMDSVTDLYDTAEVLAQLDIVVTIDTAVAHLAGALGKTVYLMLPAYAGWRWATTNRGRTSDWYPTVRLFKQSSPGDWNDVVRDIASALTDFFEPARLGASSAGPTPM